jgi:hypothetical protein
MRVHVSFGTRETAASFSGSFIDAGIETNPLAETKHVSIIAVCSTLN